MISDTVIHSAIQHFPPAREFQWLFVTAEHAIVKGKRNVDADGWKPVDEWIARAHLHGRYVIWLVVAIHFSSDGHVSEIENPTVHVVDVVRVNSTDEKGLSCELNFVELEEGDWEQLVESDGDFAAVGIDLKLDSPVDRFADYWHRTSPKGHDLPPDGMALKAPFRFMA
jgi:hypothetical protein